MQKKSESLNKSPIKCSIVMAIFNVEKYLDQAIQSICNQSEVDFELLIIDDASTDSSASIIQRFIQTDARIRLITNPKNIGQGASINVGIAQATGEYLCFFDGDDICHPDRIATQIAFLEQHSACVMVGGAVRTFCSLHNAPGVIWTYETDEDLIRIKSLFKSEYISSNMMVRRKAVRQFQTLFNTDLKIGMDWDLSLKIMKIGKVANLHDVLYDYRIHPEQMTNTLMDNIKSDSAKIRVTQLRELGIEPTELELKIHLAISPCNYWPLGQHTYFEELKPVIQMLSQQWFDKLLQHNKKAERYHAEKFARYLKDLDTQIALALSNTIDYKTCPALGKVKCNTTIPCKKLTSSSFLAA